MIIDDVIVAQVVAALREAASIYTMYAGKAQTEMPLTVIHTAKKCYDALDMLDRRYDLKDAIRGMSEPFHPLADELNRESHQVEITIYADPGINVNLFNHRPAKGRM